jgi:hypothetical protein
LAEELESVVNETSAAPSAGAVLGFTPVGWAVAFSPLAFYSIFWIYREKINPRAKLSDFLFILAAIVVIGNILSILIFKRRFF